MTCPLNMPRPAGFTGPLEYGLGCNTTSTNPHSFQRLIYIRYSEPDCLAHFEVGDETGHSPVVELAAADFKVGGEFLFGHQVDFGARRRWVRFHAHCCCVNVWPLLDRKI